MLRAIGNWVFIRRDEQKDTHNGIDISEKAQVKSYRGTIASVGKNDFVSNGERVLIPHYRTIDYDIDGGELAVAEVGNLFAKEEGDDFLPINGFVKVLKCQHDHIRDEAGKVALHMTDGYLENTQWVEILDVADDCQHLTKEDIGSFCFAPESSDDLQRILYSKEYCLKESAIEFVTGD